MKPKNSVGLGSLDWADVEACTLPTAKRPLRVAEFNDLFEANLRSIEFHESRTRARLLLNGGAALVRRIKQLAEAETSCCSFFTFEVNALDKELVALDVAVPRSHAGVLAGLVDQARTALGRAS